MLSLSQTNSTLRQLIDRNDDFWKESLLGKSTNFMKDKRIKAYENFVKQRQQKQRLETEYDLVSSSSTNGHAVQLDASWKHFYLYARQEVHKHISKEICDFIMKKNSLSYVTGDREKKLPDVEKVKFFDADGMVPDSLQSSLTNIFNLV
jgi:hypothetical protein